RPHEVDVDDRLEAVGAQPGDRHRKVAGRVVHQDVEAAEALEHGVDGGGHLVVAAHVTHRVHRVDTGGGERIDGGAQVLLLAAADGDPRAVLAEHVRCVQAETRRPAGDEGDAALQQVGS